MKLLKGCLRAVVSRSHLAIEELSHSCPGMIGLWVLHAVLIPCGSSIADKRLFCKQHPVLFLRVNSWIELEHVLNLAYENCEVILLVAAAVQWHDGSPLCRQMNRSVLFWHRKLSKSI
jgi:hypothetical protein